MDTQLKMFRVTGLHGRKRVICVRIRDNKLVLVGENGTGKSTVANLLYYVLTKQWRKLVDYRFDELSVSTEEETVNLTHDDVAALASSMEGTAFSRHFRERVTYSMWRNLHRVQQMMLFDEADEAVAVERISELARVPRHVAHEYFLEFQQTKASKLRKPLLQETKKLESWKFGQFLYLPTYRRIEQDLKSIFPGVDVDEKIREFRERFRARDRSTFVELIEFGMEDVERTITARMAQIKESVRTGLSTLTGTYLREVIRGLDAPDLSFLRSLEAVGVQSMFARIDEATLPPADKELLQRKIAEISKGHGVDPNERVIAHFISKLVALYQEQQTQESDVRDFVRLCNDYLTGKKFVYDDVKYEMFIKATEPEALPPDVAKLELKVLSSGEKQIVSLFSHIYFSGESRFFVVIDEPELSLSVPWQQKFLPDIIKTQRCSGIVAVTHSPFIWDNDLEPNVVALAECISSSDVVH